MPNSIKKSWAVHPFMSHWQGGIYIHEKGQIAPKWSWAHFFSRRSFLWQQVCVWQRISSCKATTCKASSLPAACTRIYLQLLRCWLRGQESQFSLDCLLAPCTWQRNLLAGENSVFGAGTEPLNTLEESWELCMSANLPPHTMLTHGVCPICLSLSILGSCHHGIEVPLV